MIERLKRVPAHTASVMVIGHNPTMQMLVLRLIGANGSAAAAAGAAEIADDLAAVRNKFPTGALATLRFDCAWDELSQGCARLVAYVNPKRLH